MKIIVCIKQVPDTTEVKINPTTGTLIREGIPSIINPDDKSGLEAALVLKELHGAHVTVLTMGPAQADLALREALAMGADEAILLTDRAFGGADTWATSSTIAAAIRKLDHDLIICGRQAIDGDTAQVGPQIAEHLNIPHISYVTELAVSQQSAEVKRVFEDGWQRIRVKFPCLITTLKDMNQARYMSMSGIYETYKKDVQIWGLADIDVNHADIGLKGSPTRVKASYTKGTRSAGRVYEVDPREGAKIIVDNLREKFII